MKCRDCGEEKDTSEFSVRQRYWALEDVGKPGRKPRLFYFKECKKCRSKRELKRYYAKKKALHTSEI